MGVYFLKRGGPTIAVTITVTITGAGNAADCYATINGTKQYSAGTHEVNVGDTITFGIYGSADTGWLKIDGTRVLEAYDSKSEIHKTYDWTVPSEISAIEITMKNTSTYSQITVTTS